MGECIRDTVEFNRGLGSRAGRVRCFGLEFYEIQSIQESTRKFDQSRHGAKPKLHQEHPHRKKTNPALKQEISGFLRTETLKKTCNSKIKFVLFLPQP